MRGCSPSASSEGAPKAELAHHAYMAIGRVGHGRAVSLAAEAGGAAAHSLAWNEAVTWYERVVAIDGERQLSDPRSRARLLIGLGRAMGEVGLEAEALVPLAEAAAAARVADDQEMLVEVALAYGAGGSVYADPSGAGLVIVDEALASLPPGPSRHRALLLVRRSEWVNIRDPDESRRLAEEALALADVLRDPTLRLAALTAYTNAVVGFPGHDELDDIAEEMMALIPRAGHLGASDACALRQDRARCSAMAISMAQPCTSRLLTVWVDSCSRGTSGFGRTPSGPSSRSSAAISTRRTARSKLRWACLAAHRCGGC